MTAQEHASETLRRAVSGDRVGHAYLFCGPRGVGKTTMARVLAMALNCPTRSEEGEPCGVCDSCHRIWSGHTSLDVIEIDAASNRGVDDARDLRERAMYAPSEEGRYKVYIVDEAHMLTREAWNALLKILEEPPPRVIFVFATTEPQKIQQSAAPILSRCQRFDFRRIGAGDIVARMSEVLTEEQNSAQPDALRAIARKADGGMRDALSLLDQVLALTGGEVTLDAVRLVLGLVEEERYVELFAILAERRHADVFRFVESLVLDGYDLVEVYHGLVEQLRNLVRLKLDGRTEGLDIPEHLEARFVELAGFFDVGDLVRMMALASDLETSGNLRRSPNPRPLIEMLLLRFSYLERTVTVERLLAELGGPSAPVALPSTGTGGTPGGAQAGPSRDRAEAAATPRPSKPEVQATPSLGAASVPLPVGAGLEKVWAHLVATGEGIPAGLGPFLRSAKVGRDAEGAVLLELPPGPGLERLGEAGVRGALVGALGRHLGQAPVLRVVPAVGEAFPSGRVTPDTVREARLRDLFEREPLLRHAVEELDLELLD